MAEFYSARSWEIPPLPWTNLSPPFSAERDEVARSGAKLSIVDSPEGSDAQAAAKIATLTRLKGIGENDATLLIHEIFYRRFRNRRELASWVGITPTPWASGDTQCDQGIGGDGPAWIRAALIQMAWRWVRYQPESALCTWFEGSSPDSAGNFLRGCLRRGLFW